MLLQQLDDGIQADASLDVPCDSPDRVIELWTGGSKLILPDVIEHAVDLRFYFLVEPGRFQSARIFEAGEVVDELSKAEVEGQSAPSAERSLSISLRIRSSL